MCLWRNRRWSEATFPRERRVRQSCSCCEARREMDQVSRNLGITAATSSAWRDHFAAGRSQEEYSVHQQLSKFRNEIQDSGRIRSGIYIYKATSVFSRSFEKDFHTLF